MSFVNPVLVRNLKGAGFTIQQCLVCYFAEAAAHEFNRLKIICIGGGRGAGKCARLLQEWWLRSDLHRRPHHFSKNSDTVLVLFRKSARNEGANVAYATVKNEKDKKRIREYLKSHKKKWWDQDKTAVRVTDMLKSLLKQINCY